jgi:acyl dehydratase
MLGFEFTFRFRKAVKADERIDMAWEIVSADYKRNLGGELVGLEGKATNPQGEVVLTGAGGLLCKDTFLYLRRR